MLAGKTTIVTGGASGIGAAVVRLFADRGAHVVILDQAVDMAEALAREIGNSVSVIPLDVRDVAAVRQTIAGIAERSRPEILVNSAGVVLKRDFLDCEEDEFDRLVAINLRGTFFVGQAAARAMLGTGGRIINIASIAGMFGFDTRAIYGSTKAAVLQLTRVMAVELAQHGIVVNAVAPGPVETPLVAAAHDDDYRRRVLERVPMQRYATAEDIASAVFFLAGEAAYMTGQVLTIDGGFSASAIATSARPA